MLGTLESFLTGETTVANKAQHRLDKYVESQEEDAKNKLLYEIGLALGDIGEIAGEIALAVGTAGGSAAASAAKAAGEGGELVLVTVNAATAVEAVAGAGVIVDALKNGTNLGRDIQDLIREAKGKYDENSSNVERVGKQNGKAPRDNQKQNEQVRDIAKKLNLTKDEQRELHDMISGQGYSYQEILELAEEMFGK